MIELEKIIRQFIEKMLSRKAKEENIYNEFSLQHELGIYLRRALPGNYKVQFERNIADILGLDSEKEKKRFVKHEIDIYIFNKNKVKERYAVELKYPTNGQTPNQLYMFCKDFSFMEQVKKAGFSKTYVLTLVNDDKQGISYYSGNGKNKKTKQMYKRFRDGGVIHGTIKYPLKNTKGNTPLKVIGKYETKWDTVKRNPIYHYYLYEMKPTL